MVGELNQSMGRHNIGLTGNDSMLNTNQRSNTKNRNSKVGAGASSNQVGRLNSFGNGFGMSGAGAQGGVSGMGIGGAIGGGTGMNSF